LPFSALDKALKINNITELNFRHQPFEGQGAYIAQNKCVTSGNEKPPGRGPASQDLLSY
jgi:hypothetical protein